MLTSSWQPDPDRCFSPVQQVRVLARELYSAVRDLPIVSPHGHVDPALLADPDARFGNPAELLIIPDHYVFRMLYSQGVSLGALGIPRLDGQPVETDGRKIWQLLADHIHVFRGTPTGLWLSTVLQEVLGVSEKLNPDNASRIYDEVSEKLAAPEFSPRSLFDRFNIEVLATTDSATDSLEHHQKLHETGIRVMPTFRPDSLLDFSNPDWPQRVEKLSELTGLHIGDLTGFVSAIRRRRKQFRELGATATDHSRMVTEIRSLPAPLAGSLFGKAMRGGLSDSEVHQLQAHMLFEMARLSCEDGMTMQLHLGSYRNHNRPLSQAFGPDTGSDIPVQVDWTRGLAPLLSEFGNEPGLKLILFTLDESTYGRELAPLAGHYPAVRIGPPWWFFDSVKGIERYLDQVVETAGFYNLAGFNDDTRAFASIPARHDVWRRVTSNWLAGEVTRGLMDEADAHEVARWLTVDAARAAYNLGESHGRLTGSAPLR